MLYDQERTAGGFYNYASRRVPKAVDSLKKLDDVKDWVEKVANVAIEGGMKVLTFLK